MKTDQLAGPSTERSTEEGKEAVLQDRAETRGVETDTRDAASQEAELRKQATGQWLRGWAWCPGMNRGARGTCRAVRPPYDVTGTGTPVSCHIATRAAQHTGAGVNRETVCGRGEMGKSAQFCL